jgi:Uma2 family endonuclease
MSTTTAGMTFAEFEQLPDEPGKLELLEGELVRMPPPKRKHMDVTQRLFLLLLRVVRRLRRRHAELGLGEVYIETGFKMGSDPQSWLVPDVSILHAGQGGEDYYEGAPLVAIEVASESQSAVHLEAKAQLYLAQGSREVWLLFPRTRHAWICRAGESTVEVQSDAIRSALLPGVEIRLDQIFQGSGNPQ